MISAGRDLRTTCLHEAVHITVALWSGLGVLSASVETMTDGVVRGVRLAGVGDESFTRPSRALFYAAPSIYERHILGINEISVSYGSSVDVTLFEGCLRDMAIEFAQGYQQYEEMALAIFGNRLAWQSIQSFAAALESSTRLCQTQIYAIWHANIRLHEPFPEVEVANLATRPPTGE